MEKNLEQAQKEKLKEVMSSKLDLIAELIDLKMNKCAKIETKALKAYLNFQLASAKTKPNDEM